MAGEWLLLGPVWEVLAEGVSLMEVSASLKAKAKLQWPGMASPRSHELSCCRCTNAHGLG